MFENFTIFQGNRYNKVKKMTYREKALSKINGLKLYTQMREEMRGKLAKPVASSFHIRVNFLRKK